ncbi:MAG: YbaK/EbsC family protein [Gaiellaceae bacterium]
MAKEDVTRVLDEAGAEYDLLPHEHTEAALAEAQALGLDPADVGKTLVVTTPAGYMRAVVPAGSRLDLRKLRELVSGGKKQVHLATEEALRSDYSEFELGAVPPFGGSRTDPVVVDRRIAERQSVVLEAGSHDESLRLATADLIRLTKGEVADICQD